MLQVQPLLTNGITNGCTHADLCKNMKLLTSNLRNLPLEDSEIILKLLRNQLHSIQEQLNLNRESSSRSADWVLYAKSARRRKLDSIAMVLAHIKSIKPKIEREVLTQIQREQIAVENISLKKKLAKQKAHASRMEAERRILRRLLSERVPKEFMLELDKDTIAMLNAELAKNTIQSCELGSK